METKVNYTMVGTFVIVLTIAAIVIGFWLSVGLKSEDYTLYEVYMNESVSGLSVSAPVKYNGVEVGLVKEIRLDPLRPDVVRLILQVQSDTPITENTRAVLDTQGLTGIAYLGLNGGKPGAPPLQKKPGQEYPVIKSSPSLFIRIDKALDALSKNMKEITKNVSELFSKENDVKINNTLTNIEKISDDLQRNSTKLDVIFDNAQVMFANAAMASSTLPQVMTNIENSAKSIDKLSVNLSQAGEQVRLTLQDGEIAVETLNNQVLPQAVTSLSDFQEVLSNAQEITEQLNENPSALVRGKSTQTLGPGESK